MLYKIKEFIEDVKATARVFIFVLFVIVILMIIGYVIKLFG